ncbi:MAG: VCBS repeat-containing protein, partial [Proteobacteria bacterium]|nr:VCBS repeat-containing protein [Pseudomonadota bacterium]
TRDWRALRNLALAGTVPPVQGTIPTLTGGRIHAQKALTCQNSIVEARMRPGNYARFTLAVGGTLRLEAININCALPNGAVVVTVAETGEQVTLVDDGTGTDEVAGDGLYAGTWTAHAAGTYTLTFPGRAGDVLTVDVDAQLRPGFPARTDETWDVNGMLAAPVAPLVVGTLGSDPRPSMLMPGVSVGPLYAFRGDGTPVPGWPNYAVWESVETSIGVLPTDPTGHFVVAAGQYSSVNLYSGSGAPLAGWPQVSANVWYPAPTIDLDGDGSDEVILYPARHADGSLVSPTLTIPVMAPATSLVSGSVAVADLDADGLADFVVADNVNVYASNVQGLLAGFPTLTPNNSAGTLLYPVVGDVTGDGTPKIVLPTTVWQGSFGSLTVNVLDNRGRLLRSLPTGGDNSGSGIALADLDGDGIPEILVASGPMVYAWHGDGTLVPGWPVSFPAGTWLGALAVGDVTGSGAPEVVFMSATYASGGAAPPAQIQVLDAHGQTRPGFPRPILATLLAGTPVIADLDGDGRHQLLIAKAPEGGTRDSLFAYDFGASGPFGPIEWGQYMGGPEHRGYYELGKNLASQAYLTAQAHGAGTIASADGALRCGTSCIHLYPKGTSVSLSASPSSGAVFSGWLGACAGQGNPCTVSLARYTAVAADFASPIAITIAGSGTGTVTSSPSGLACPGACSATFAARSTVTLTAAPAAGMAFAGWSGDCAGTAPTCTLVVDGAKAVGASFVDHWRLAVGFGGSGSARLTSSPAGIDCGATCSAGFAPGTAVTLSATPANDTYVADWGAPGCLNYLPTCTVTLTADTAITVTLAKKPTVALTLVGNGWAQVVWMPMGATSVQTLVKCTASCTVPVDPGVSVELDASAASGWSLTGFSGDCTSTLSPCYLYSDASKSVTVTFTGNPRVDVTVSGNGHGTVTSSDGLLACPSTCTDPVPSGHTVTLTAAADATSRFAGWSGACGGSAVACTLTITGATSVGASFAATSTTGGGSGSGSGSGGGGSGGGGGGGGALDPWSLVAFGAVALGRARRRSHVV